MSRSLAVVAAWAIACHFVGGDDEMAEGEHDGGAAQEEHDRRVCASAWDELVEGGCPAGSAPRIHRGGSVSVALVEDVAMPICDGMGYLIDADAVGGAQWVGYELTQTSVCTVGCVVSYCQAGQDTCLGLRLSGGVCGAYCGEDIDEQDCRDFALGCNGVEPEDGESGSEECGASS